MNAGLIIYIGHYGSGKTELAMQQALDGAAAGRRVALVDQDNSALSREIGRLLDAASSTRVAAHVGSVEEAKDLLLRGASGFVRPWIAAVAVSIVFGLVHRGAEVWIFLCSLVLCWMAIACRLGSLQRAVVHGTTNALVMLWYFTDGFGLFA